MKVNKLIRILEKIKSEKGGSIEVVASAFGKNIQAHYHHATFNFQPPKRKKWLVKDQINGLGQLCLCIGLTDSSETGIRKRKKEMKELGYFFIPSQYVKVGESIIKE
jgi:hypothetical protein